MSHATGSRPRGGLRQTFAAFGYRNYRILWLSMAASFTAMQMQMVARGWLAHDISGTNAAVGLVMLSWGIPQLLFSLVGGAYADRLDKRRLLTVTQSLVGLTALVTAVLITIDVISIPWLFALGLFQGTVFAFNMPARQALVPELVPREELANAIALNNAAMNGTRIFAPAVAGVLMVVLGVDVVFYLQAALNFGVVAILWQLPRSTAHVAGAAERRNVLHDIGAGLRYLWASPALRLLMLMAFVPSLVGMPYVTLLPGFAAEELHVGSGAYGTLLAVSGAGALAGSLAIAWLGHTRRLALLQVLLGLGFGVSLVTLGLLARAFGYPGALVAHVALGLASTGYMTVNSTMLMAGSEPALHGRVMSIYMLTFSVFPLMSAPLGALADRTSASATFVLLGVVIAAFMALVALVSPGRLLRPEPPRRAPAPVSAGDD
ncbi:MAG: MFS transporter [Chloroflexi bacterium]|nr:MFS transporter [Chloroflexota bacterium]